MEQCVLCGEQTTARTCRDGQRHLAHLTAWEVQVIRRRQRRAAVDLRRTLRNHIPIWERDQEVRR